MVLKKKNPVFLDSFSGHDIYTIVNRFILDFDFSLILAFYHLRGLLLPDTNTTIILGALPWHILLFGTIFRSFSLQVGARVVHIAVFTCCMRLLLPGICSAMLGYGVK